MADFLGRISVPLAPSSGLTFPLVSDFGYGFVQQFNKIEHRFGELATLATQRFLGGVGPRRFKFQRKSLARIERTALINFYESMQGSYKSFIYNAPNADKTTTAYEVVFDIAPISIEDLINRSTVGLVLREVSATGPAYTINNTVVRFPSNSLSTALAAQDQVLIPMVHIRPRECDLVGTTLPDNIYLSNRRCTIGFQTYLPRLLNLGQAGSSDIIMSQDIEGTADNVQFQFGNADRAMTLLVNDTDLNWASIDLCLYHVGTGTVIQLWKGAIVPGGWRVDGSPVFTVQASDGLYQINLQWPNVTLSSSCWKTFNDPNQCPYSTVGSGGDPNTCDYTFDGPNGCLSHHMSPASDGKAYFGGQPAQPQSVRIKDNSTGTWGLGRNTVTATSIVSDTVWNRALPRIWCNDDGDPGRAFWTNALVIAGRDESDFFAALGVVGAGPIGQYTGMSVYQNADGYRYIIAPELDGQNPHGFKVDGGLNVVTNDPTKGLRQVLGFNPVLDPAADSFSLGDGVPQRWGPEQSAGTAFVEIRRTDESGIQVSNLTSEHAMRIPISKGLYGLTINSSGVPSVVSGLTNLFWIAISEYLNATGKSTGDDVFVLDSLVNLAGTGCAQIADTIVPVLVGTGTEKQFRFQGVLSQQKSFRQWLQEILNCGLGWYTFEYGRLRLGIRYNATPTSAFTLGNILFQSLSLQPITANFEKLTVEFADVNYQYQLNTATYTDKTHADYYGRRNAPVLAPAFRLAGCGGLSQALRIAATRVREEVGGVNTTEWKNAREAIWRTTILALDTYVGQVVSLTHPDVPGGVGNFRIKRWTLFKDYSVQIEARTVTPSMYDLETGPEVTAVHPEPLPALSYPQPLGPTAAPFQVQAHGSDALFPSEWNFDASQTYISTQASPIAYVVATTKLTINSFIPDCGSPTITNGSITESSSGGSIKGGLTIRVAICATMADGKHSPPSQIILLQTATGSNTHQFTIHDIVWPNFAGLTGYVIFASSDDQKIGAQVAGSLSGSNPYTPTSITVTALNWDTPYEQYALPNSNIVATRIKSKRLIHGGVLGVAAGTVSGTTVACPEAIDISSVDNWAGRKLINIGRPGSSTPFTAFNIVSFDPATGTFGLDRTANDLSHPEWSIQTEDAIVVGFQGYDNSSNPYSLVDTGLLNASSGFAGLIASAEKGEMVRVITGKGRGKTAKILDNSSTGYTLSAPIEIDSGSTWIVESGTWESFVDSSSTENSDALTSTGIKSPTANYLGQPLLLGEFTVDLNGYESPDGDIPIRMLWIYGKGLTVQTLDSTGSIDLTTDVLLVDSSAGGFNVQAPDLTQVQHEIFIRKVSSDSNTVVVLPFGTQTFDGQTSLSLTDQYVDWWRILPIG